MITLETRVALQKKRKRVGRGGARGGMSGRGHDGQKCRSGAGVRTFFEGGQMPLVRRMPKRGFSNALFRDEWTVVNVGRLEALFPEVNEITREQFVAAGVVGARDTSRIKVLGHGTCAKRFVVQADAFSATARAAIEKAGGQVRLTGE